MKRRDLHDRIGRPDIAEELSVHRGDGLPVVDANQESASADHVAERRPRLSRAAPMISRHRRACAAVPLATVRPSGPSGAVPETAIRWPATAREMPTLGSCGASAGDERAQMSTPKESMQAVGAW